MLFSSASAERKGLLANVYVDAQAGEDYLAGKESNRGLKAETFHIMQGRHFQGSRLDPSLENTSFLEIAAKLRAELKVRNFHPAKEFKDGDLLLVVHWGITDEDYDPDDPQNDIGFGDEEEDALAEEEAIADPTWTSLSELDREYTRGEEALRMLGFERAMKAKGTSLLEEKKLAAQMHGDRYFIIVNAYDWQKKLKTGESELLWVTRFSVDSSGTNFTESFPALLRAARDYYGVELDKMVHTQTNYGDGEVSMGELEVLESAEDERDID
ncbi:hypothetical protein [Pelagicoccus sp. SDUM812005]|uniref:hypothetical protein n=1 Tax=Pelagicoccus sp. SDUM812005 TaxID=3041257 RepID=UPI002810BEC3|nr:hypothetical protein [Pelagicoccus sp. SDUM812005]